MSQFIATGTFDPTADWKRQLQQFSSVTCDGTAIRNHIRSLLDNIKPRDAAKFSDPHT